MVFGFSGPLAGAYQVMEALKRNLKAYSKPPVARNLQKDVERWIRYEYQQIKKEERKNLSFILATVEPSREAHSKWRSSDGKEKQKPAWFGSDPPEMQIFALKPKKSKPNQLYKEEKGLCKTLGVGEDVASAIQDKIQELFGFSFKEPEQQAVVIGNVLMATLMQKQVDTVGGLFQIAVLGTGGIKWLTYGSGDFYLDIVNGKYVQQDKTTGKTIPLKPIWEWWQDWQANKSKRLGSIGIFEDSDLRRAINKDDISEH